MTPAEFEAWLLAKPSQRRPLVMGILNVTPDSFSDGGRYIDVEAAAAYTRQMVEDGADLIDVGGESTRPGSQPVPPGEQVRRVAPVIEAIVGGQNGLPVTISIDTTRSAVAAAALDAGASVINDISGGREDPAMLPLAAERGAPVVLMHMQGTPATMQSDPRYTDVTAEVRTFLAERVAAAESAGIAAHRVILDPGIGFGKNQDHNLTLLRQLGDLAAIGRPLLLGTSRKGFIGRITGQTDPADRVFGTAATVAWSIANGASLVRVHDVGPMSQVVQMVRAIQDSGDDR